MMFRRKSKRAQKKKSTPPPPPPPPMMETTPSIEEEPTAEDPWSEENCVACFQQWELTHDQQCAMMELQDQLSDVEHWKNDPFEVVRFLKELKWNVTAAEDKFRKMVHWRVENDVDNTVENYGAPHPLLEYFPSVILKGVDKEGDPIFLERPGAFDAYAFYKEFGTQGLVDYITYRRERDITRTPGARGWQQDYYEPTYQRRVRQYTVIMDVEGLNRSHMRAGLLPLLNRLARLTQDYYAGVAKRIIVLRAPSIFKLFWSLVQGFFDPCIRELVTFTTHADYLDVLDQYIDRQVLPPELDAVYGKGGYMPGFESVILKGGKMTKEIMDHCNGKKRSSVDLTETTVSETSGGSVLFTDSDSETSNSVHPLEVTQGVRVAGGKLGGGTFRGQAIYLN